MTQTELNALAVQNDDTHAMNAGCTDYACYCHAKVPVLVAEIRRLRSVLEEIAGAAVHESSPRVYRLAVMAKKALEGQTA